VTSIAGELISRIRAGDEEAFNRLFQIVSTRLLIYIATRIRLRPALRSRIDPEDVFQTTCLLAFRNFHRFEYRRPGDFSRWTTTIARNEIASLARQIAARRRALGPERSLQEPIRRSEESQHDLGDFLPSKLVTASQHLIVKERYEAVVASMRRLTPEQAEVVLGRIYEGKSPSEIAGAMGKSDGAVSELFRRALEKMRAATGARLSGSRRG